MKHRKLSILLAGRGVAFTICTALLSSCSALSAQPVDGHGGPRKPPAEALEACKSKTSGQECGFTSQHGAVKGTCWAPEGRPMACKPKDAPANNPISPKQ